MTDAARTKVLIIDDHELVRQGLTGAFGREADTAAGYPENVRYRRAGVSFGLPHVVGIPVAAGLLYPAFGLLLSPILASAAMAFSS